MKDINTYYDELMAKVDKLQIKDPDVLKYKQKVKATVENDRRLTTVQAMAYFAPATAVKQSPEQCKWIAKSLTTDNNTLLQNWKKLTKQQYVYNQKINDTEANRQLTYHYNSQVKSNQAVTYARMNLANGLHQCMARVTPNPLDRYTEDKTLSVIKKDYIKKVLGGRVKTTNAQD